MHARTATPAVRRACGAGRPAVRGLIQVLVGADPVPAWRSPWLRRAVYAGLAIATATSCLISVGSLVTVSGPAKELAPFGFRARKVFQVGFLPTVRPSPLSWVLAAGPGGAIALGVLVALAVVAPLPLAARYPLMGWRLGWLGLVLVSLVSVTSRGEWPWGMVQLAVLLVVFCAAGVRVRRAALWWMWALTLVVWWLPPGGGRPGLVAGVAGSLVVTGAAVAAGALGAWRRARQALASAAERTELEQARRAVLEERARIARELHDVVAHHMSLIAVRAETAPFRLAGLDAGVAAEFASLSGGARSALADMRRLLGVLRADQPAGLAPQPQLGDVPALIEGARRAGVGVVFSQQAGPAAVPGPVGVCAYRIVQESLSNASRHAPGAPVSVTIGHDPHAVLLRVENGPRRAAGGPGPAGGPGHGLAGMRERVGLLGGSLAAGPSRDGGFVVSAVLPIIGSA